ncbi:MAG: hypothetical protein ACFFCQ_15175, partial [Promethearchaeota archaeon]
MNFEETTLEIYNFFNNDSEHETIEGLLINDNGSNKINMIDLFSHENRRIYLHTVDNKDIISLIRNKDNLSDINYLAFIIIDLSTPKKEGVAVLTEIRSNKNFQDIPLIILTASESQSEIFRKYGLHADA